MIGVFRSFLIVIFDGKFLQASRDLPTAPHLCVPTTPTLFLRLGNFVGALWESIFRYRARLRGDVFSHFYAVSGDGSSVIGQCQSPC
jgi:hypothetical protein